MGGLQTDSRKDWRPGASVERNIIMMAVKMRADAPRIFKLTFGVPSSEQWNRRLQVVWLGAPNVVGRNGTKLVRVSAGFAVA